MPHVVAALAAEWNAACEIAAEPAADDAGAPLASCSLKPRPCLPLLAAIWALYCLRGAFRVDTRHSLVLF